MLPEKMSPQVQATINELIKCGSEDLTELAKIMAPRIAYIFEIDDGMFTAEMLLRDLQGKP